MSLGTHPETRYVRNSFGDAVIEVTHTNPAEILITAKYVTKSEMTDADKTCDVESVYRAPGSLDRAFVALIANYEEYRSW